MFWTKEDSKNLKSIADSLRTLVEEEAYNTQLIKEEAIDALKLNPSLIRKLLKKEEPKVGGGMHLEPIAIKEEEDFQNEIASKISFSNQFYPEDSLSPEDLDMLQQ